DRADSTREPYRHREGEPVEEVSAAQLEGHGRSPRVGGRVEDRARSRGRRGDGHDGLRDRERVAHAVGREGDGGLIERDVGTVPSDTLSVDRAVEPDRAPGGDRRGVEGRADGVVLYAGRAADVVNALAARRVAGLERAAGDRARRLALARGRVARLGRARVVVVAGDGRAADALARAAGV